MLITQANPGWDQSDPTRAPLRDPRTLVQTDANPDGFRPFLDSAGRKLETFTRVETFGNNQGNGTNDVQWLKVVVDVKSREVFSFEPRSVPGNRVAMPPP